MKKIFCARDEDDFVEVGFSQDGVFIAVQQEDEYSAVVLNPKKIRKLRKQLKKALLQIEGVKEREWKPGDKVFLIHGNNEGPDYKTSPSAFEIDLRHPVMLKHLMGGERWIFSYTNTNGENIETGYASEHSFGKRAD